MMKEVEQYSGKEEKQRPFYLENVVQENSVESRVSRRFLLLTCYDFEKVFGKAPRARDPKAPMVTLPDVDGCMTTYYCFVDPQHPFRELTVSAAVGESRAQEVLARQDHVHSQHAEHMQNVKTERRLSGSGASALLGNQQWALCTLSEYQARLWDWGCSFWRGARKCSKPRMATEPPTRQ